MSEQPFRNLTRLSLDNLPQLESIYWTPLPFPVLKYVKVRGCPNLRRLPFNSNSAKGYQVRSDLDQEWIKGVEWEDEATKQHFSYYGELAKCHTLLTNKYESILDQESNAIPFIDATYYRVGFYGEKFGKLDRKEYVYREPRDVRLGDIMEKLSHIYESRMDSNHILHIIPDSRQVKAEELQAGACYLQITAVDAVMEDEDLGSRRERIFSLSTGSVRARVFDRFLFDTPFTKNGKTQGGLEDQWKRRTVLQTEGSFPALVNRLLVTKSESLEFSPVENAIGMIETRTTALRNKLEEPRSSDGDHLPRLQSLQRILQGSVAVQVNSGVLSVCTAFLSGEPATRLRSQELQQLIATLLEFMAVCKRAIRVHFRLIGEEDQEFHTQLVNGFQSLTAELSHYIPAILSEL